MKRENVMVEKNKPSHLLVGQVVSADKMAKTIVVQMERTVMHDRLQKVLRTVRKFKVHDENQQAKMGDLVEIYEGRPVSKTKYMYLHKILTVR